MYISHKFKAFNTDILIGIIPQKNNSKKIIDRIEKTAQKFEKKFSRFDSQSELQKLNHSNEPIKVSQEMIELLMEAKKAYQKTNGIFDPTISVSLQNIGYNQSLDILKDRSPKQNNEFDPSPEVKKNFRKRIKFKVLKIDKNKNIVKFPKNFNIDLGGIAKGYFVDKAQKILNQYSQNFWISAGGDVYVKGKNEDGKPWEVGVENPLALDSDILKLKLPTKGMGIATSGVTKRKGMNGKFFWHHIIDPRTGLPANNSILAVTVLAKTTTKADIMAKTTLILGIKKGLELINKTRDHECLIINHNQKIYFSKGIKKYLCA